MHERQLEKFKIRLEEMQREILGESEDTVLAMQEESTLYPDPNDRASLETEHINNLRIRDRERKLLTKVQEALDRVDKKTFGICEECGEEIGRNVCSSGRSLHFVLRVKNHLKQKRINKLLKILFTHFLKTKKASQLIHLANSPFFIEIRV